ncbi:Hypothetical_protein [Hexamita inflata]|uniref:Hypothetical_protein n=1 Tax=Hexamita inflata TaxID=28002 RepID=A0AA86R8H7_9EUKA|nr:Hypothetical protein HINF_LOCUS61011 [Hexamita inflata]
MEFCCLTPSKALAALTLPVDFSLARLHCLHLTALPVLCPRFSQQFSLSHFPYQDSRPTLVSRFSTSNPGRESELLALKTHFLRIFVQKQGKIGFRPELPWTNRSSKAGWAAWSTLKQALSSLCLLIPLLFSCFVLCSLPCSVLCPCFSLF